MARIVIDNETLIDAVYLNDLTNVELATILRQVFRAVERRVLQTEGGDFSRAVLLNNLLASADWLEVL